MTKAIIPASPGYFIMVPFDEGDGYYADSTPVIAWRIDDPDVVEPERREDAEAIGVTRLGGSNQTVFGP